MYIAQKWIHNLKRDTYKHKKLVKDNKKSGYCLGNRHSFKFLLIWSIVNIRNTEVIHRLLWQVEKLLKLGAHIIHWKKYKDPNHRSKAKHSYTANKKRWSPTSFVQKKKSNLKQILNESITWRQRHEWRPKHLSQDWRGFHHWQVPMLFWPNQL